MVEGGNARGCWGTQLETSWTDLISIGGQSGT